MLEFRNGEIVQVKVMWLTWRILLNPIHPAAIAAAVAK